MVCDSCEAKQGSNVCVPDKWKTGARNVVAIGAVRPGKTNKLLAAKAVGAQWLPQESRCRLCQGKVLAKMHYCNDCAHKRGICTMCGKKVLDTKSYNMSST